MMKDNYFGHIVHGGDYNPDQWTEYPGVIDEDMRLMKLAGINSATVGIFSWSRLEPEEGVYDFSWLDGIMDKCAAEGIDVILATPSGARPAWLAEKYPEVLRVNENGIRNEFGVRHNHCPTSPVYREKVRNINTLLAKRYAGHSALKMWHISNEYSGVCHCSLCQEKFRAWLSERYGGDIKKLNADWWNGFWSHNYNGFSQINSPKDRGENHSSSLKLAWYRFVSENTIDFFENEIAPIREFTPDIPVTTNFMQLYTPLDYQKFAKHLDIVSWDSYPWLCAGIDGYEIRNTAMMHDFARSALGKPFMLMESTPSIVNHKRVNKLIPSELTRLTSLLAVACGSDSVQYFQWRKSRGSHEKWHGAVVDHCGHENTRVFRGIAQTGALLKKISEVAGSRTESKVALVFDFENCIAIENFSGYNNIDRDYKKECLKWYSAFYDSGVSVDVIASDADFSKYALVVAPFLYMMKEGVPEAIEKYVSAGGAFVGTYLTAAVNCDDLAFLGGMPGGVLKDVFGVVAEETDSIPSGLEATAEYKGKTYPVKVMCDLLNLNGAGVLGTYTSDFYAGTPAVTVNRFGKGRAYYAAFGSEGDFFSDFCSDILTELNIAPDTAIKAPENVFVRKRGDCIFILNFNAFPVGITPDRKYVNIPDGGLIKDETVLGAYGYLILKEKITEVAGAMIINEEGKMMICRRPATKGNPLKWEFPGGKLEPGESGYEALTRECREELDITVRGIKPVCDIIHAYPDITVKLTVYDSVIEQGQPKLLEHIELKWVGADELDDIDFCDADIDILDKVRAYLNDKNAKRNN